MKIKNLLRGVGDLMCEETETGPTAAILGITADGPTIIWKGLMGDKPSPALKLANKPRPEAKETTGTGSE
jgi:hypothetical protein